MNITQYLKETVVKLEALITAFETGFPVSGTDLTDIKTNTSDTATNTADTVTGIGVLTGCTAANLFKVNTTQLGGNNIAVNSGVLSTGTQRVCIATDDVNLQKISNCVNAGTGKVEVNASISGVPQTNLTYLVGNSVAANSGTLSTGTQRVCIATDDVNLAAINTAITTLSNCVDAINNHIEVDTNAINGVMTSVNGGVLNDGTQRVSLATNDQTAAHIHDWASGWFPAMNVVLRGIRYGSEDQPIDIGSDNVYLGTQRVCIANNDTNLAAINANISTIKDDIGGIKAVIDDVYNSTNHTLEVTVVP